jgi:hypothetical protein
MKARKMVGIACGALGIALLAGGASLAQADRGGNGRGNPHNIGDIHQIGSPHGKPGIGNGSGQLPPSAVNHSQGQGNGGIKHDKHIKDLKDKNVSDLQGKDLKDFQRKDLKASRVMDTQVEKDKDIPLPTCT